MNRRSILITASIATVVMLSMALMRRPDGFLAEAANRPQNVTIPAGAKLHIRLEEAISTTRNRTGDLFHASLDGPLMVDGKQVALPRSKVLGQLAEVKQSGRIKGRARITMVLTKLVAGNKEYNLRTEPLTFTAPRTWKRDAYLLAGSSALGAVIGAIAGGGKGAAIGAGIGGGAGTGWWLTTRGAPVAYGPETRLTFTLAQPLRAPVQNKTQRM